MNLKKLKQKLYFFFFHCSLDCQKCVFGEIRIKQGVKREYCTRKNIWGDKIK